MNYIMLTTRNNFKIFNPIIKFISVKMMNYFFGFKITIKMFFHYKTMFSDISKSIAKWVIALLDKFISIVHINTSIPFPIFISRYFRTMSFVTAFNRTIFTPILSNSPFFYFKFLTTKLTNSFNVVHKLIINPNDNLVKT